MNASYGVEVWSTPEWREGAAAWLDGVLTSAGIERTGPLEQTHLRAWATVLRAPTSSGTVWLKAPGPTTRFEVALYPLLERLAPARVLSPIAVDLERGFVVLPDGGTCLADRLGEHDLDLASALERVLPQYAELQLSLAPHAAELLELGVADMRAPIMPARFEEALAAVQSTLKAAGTAEARDTWQRVAELRPVFVEWCARLGEAPGAPSLDHNDLHPWNILVSGSGDSLQARFYDWGDSVVCHPFASLLVGLGFLKGRLGAADDDPRLVRVRDAYLEVFGELGSHRELVETLELACRVGKIARTLIWVRSVTLAGGSSDPQFRDAPLESLGTLLDASYLGRA